MAKGRTLMIAAMGMTIAAGPRTSNVAPVVLRTVPVTTINCLLASNVFARRETDPNKKTLAHDTLLFYLGRLDERTSATQLKAQFEAAAINLKGANATLLMNGCLQELRAKAQVLQSVGRVGRGK